MSNPYEPPKTNDEGSSRKVRPFYLPLLLFAGLFLGGVMAYRLLSRPAPIRANTPVVTPAQQPVQAELEN